jgi:peptide/nickel transport system substrate-binding protein
MESFSSFFITKKFPSRATIRAILRGPLTALSALVYGLFFAICATIFILIIVINNHFLVTVPARGGTLTEGVIGSPHYINPLLASTPTDQRLTALVYGNLMTMQADGTIVPSLAQSYTVSPDGTVYTIDLLPKLRFDDGKPLTSEDVSFTVQKMQDNTISTVSNYWQNISVDTPDANTVVFTLPAADTSFMSHLTFGILPEHVWQNISDETFETASQNLAPVGAGAFKVTGVAYQNGIPSIVTLERNAYAAGTPALLKSLVIKSFANQSMLISALNSRDADFSYSVTPDGLAQTPLISRLQTEAVPTDQTVAIYRSSSDTALANATTVLKLSQIIDKNAIIATVQHGYGASINEATANSVANTGTTVAIPTTGFSVAVENDPSLLLAAQTLAEQLAQQGVSVSIKAFDPGVFQQSLTAGTFSLFLARSNDYVIPSQYSMVLPLYTESLPYVFAKDTHTIIPSPLTSPTMEYSSVSDWYTNTDKLWKWFIHKK